MDIRLPYITQQLPLAELQLAALRVQGDAPNEPIARTAESVHASAAAPSGAFLEAGSSARGGDDDASQPGVPVSSLDAAPALPGAEAASANEGAAAPADDVDFDPDEWEVVPAALPPVPQPSAAAAMPDKRGMAKSGNAAGSANRRGTEAFGAKARTDFLQLAQNEIDDSDARAAHVDARNTAQAAGSVAWGRGRGRGAYLADRGGTGDASYVYKDDGYARTDIDESGKSAVLDRSLFWAPPPQQKPADSQFFLVRCL